ncbi:MAG TPA: hypothetical protein IGR64_00240 [Leptolyngbyaceae cyanobacterium M65_K2018_010]|nr:hypothetical protein [Leptolyngbyaceae cyanobacterium M65_K2018_010]
MAKSFLTPSRSGYRVPQEAVQAAQLALAIADEAFLRSLITDSLPAIAHPHEVGSVSIQVGVPLRQHPQRYMDAVLTFEHINCVLAGSYPEAPPPPEFDSHSQYQAVTSCHSDLTTLAQNVTPTEAVALLARSGFDPEQIHQILHLPSQAWHKSWWYTLDPEGFLTVPFQRWMRSRCFADGTFTFQFKDYYAQERPPGFCSQPQQLPVVVHQPSLGFCDNLARINLTRRELNTAQALLVADDLTELEVEGYIRQNVSLAKQRGLQTPLAANCRMCRQDKCPLHGIDSSPVMACRSYRSPELGV